MYYLLYLNCLCGLQNDTKDWKLMSTGFPINPSVIWFFCSTHSLGQSSRLRLHPASLNWIGRPAGPLAQLSRSGEYLGRAPGWTRPTLLPESSRSPRACPKRCVSVGEPSPPAVSLSLHSSSLLSLTPVHAYEKHNFLWCITCSMKVHSEISCRWYVSALFFNVATVLRW